VRESLCVGGCIFFCVYERKCLRAKERKRDGERRQRLSARTCASVVTFLTRQVISQCSVMLQQFAMSIDVMVQEEEVIYVSIYLSIYLFIYLSIYLSIHACIHPSIHLSVYMPIHTKIHEPLLTRILLFIQ